MHTQSLKRIERVETNLLQSAKFAQHVKKHDEERMLRVDQSAPVNRMVLTVLK
jgi:hypothetical protein